MDGNADGSSSAAQRARPTTELPQNRPNSFFGWAFRRRTSAPGTPKPATDQDRATAAGQRRMLVNLRNMRDLRVEDVAVPRADITCVPADSNLQDLIGTFRESGFSRIPVYDETLDNPMGLVHLKDVALTHGFCAKDNDEFAIQPLLRPLIFAPPSMPITALLQRMQSERMHMALVIDEYGGVDGLLTMEDLVEQIVGEIVDEHDTEDASEWLEEAPGCYRADARAPLTEFEAAAGVDLLPDDLDEEVETLGGLVFMLAGHVPARGEVVLHPAGHEVEVLEADPRRIKRLRVRLKGVDPMTRAAE